MWFKFNLLGASVRVPLTGQGPKLEASHLKETFASLVDLFPAFTDIASDGAHDAYAAPILVRSLLDLPTRGSEGDKIFNGEGLYALTTFMIKSNLKPVHSRTDPKMQLDLSNDPLEPTILADDPVHCVNVNAMFAETQTV